MIVDEFSFQVLACISNFIGVYTLPLKTAFFLQTITLFSLLDKKCFSYYLNVSLSCPTFLEFQPGL